MTTKEHEAIWNRVRLAEDPISVRRGAHWYSKFRIIADQKLPPTVSYRDKVEELVDWGLVAAASETFLIAVLRHLRDVMGEIGDVERGLRIIDEVLADKRFTDDSIVMPDDPEDDR